jgi:hypothetical protein
MTHYEVELDTPQREELGPTASPADFAFPPAHALTAFDRRGASRPAYQIVCTYDDGQKRGPTDAEQPELRAALEDALDQPRASCCRA